MKACDRASPTSTMTLPAVLPNGVAETLEVYSENYSTVYAREWLWGLEILSNSLAITGEFSGNGKERQKILSDFEIDPMLLAGKRDNLIYQPQGNSVRFFQLNQMLNLQACDDQQRDRGYDVLPQL